MIEFLSANPESELAVAYQLIGPVLEKFVTIVDIQVPSNVEADAKKGVFVTSVGFNTAYQYQRVSCCSAVVRRHCGV